MFKDNYSKFFLNILIGTGIGILIMLIVLLLMGLCALFLDLSEEILSPLATVALGIGAFFSGYISGKLIKEKALFVGLLSGLLIYIIVSLISAFVSKNSISLISLFHFVVVFISEILGAIIGVNNTNKRKII